MPVSRATIASRLVPPLLFGLVIVIGCLQLSSPASGAAPQAPTPSPHGSSDEQRAEQRARAYLSDIFGAEPLDRAQVEIRASENGWMVVYHDAYVACGEGTPGSPDCGWGPVPQRDVFACIARDGFRIYGLQSSEDELGTGDHCTVTAPRSLFPPCPRPLPTLGALQPTPTPAVCPTFAPATPIPTPTPMTVPSAVPLAAANQLTAEEQQAVDRALQSARLTFGSRAVARSQLEIYPVGDGWILLLFLDAWASCAEGGNGPGWCRWFVEPRYIDVSQDAYVCVSEQGSEMFGRGGRQPTQEWFVECQRMAQSATAPRPTPIRPLAPPPPLTRTLIPTPP